MPSLRHIIITMFPAHIQQPCLNVYCLALYASAQIGFSIAQLTVGLSIIVHHLYLGRIYNSSPNPRIQTKPFIFTHIGISCLIVMDIISMFFSYFPLFSEADSSQGGPQDRPRGVQPLGPSLPRFWPTTTCPKRTQIQHTPSGNALSYPLLGKAPNCAWWRCNWTITRRPCQ